MERENHYSHFTGKKTRVWKYKLAQGQVMELNSSNLTSESVLLITTTVALKL